MLAFKHRVMLFALIELVASIPISFGISLFFRAWRCDIQGSSEGLLNGKTIAIKDNIAIAGVPMSCGSRILESYTPEIDATVVTRILDAGKMIQSYFITRSIHKLGNYSANLNIWTEYQFQSVCLFLVLCVFPICL